MKKSSIILSLLTLMAAIATLPALGDLNYLKNNYTYLEKIPIKEISSYTNNKDKETGKLLDNNKNTEWISWKENVIWAEDYSQPRYFTSTIIDGVNEGTSTDKNNTEATIANNSLTVPATGAKYRQFRIFDSSVNPELKLLKAGTYTLTMRYRGEVADNSATAFFGTWNGNSEEKVIGVPSDWETRTFDFTLPNDITNPDAEVFCAIQPRSNAGTFEVDWAELSYQAPTTILPKISEMAPDDYLNGQYADFLTLENGIIDTYKTDGLYQFRVAEGINLVKDNYYKATIQIQGTVSGELVLWCGSFNGKKFTVPTTDINTVEIEFGNCITDSYNTYLAIQTSDLSNEEYHSYAGHIRVKQVILEHRDVEGNWVVDKTVNYRDFQNWPYKTTDDYIPSLVTENGKTVAKVTNPGNAYSFRLGDNISIPKGKYKLQLNIKANDTGKIHFMVGTGTSYADYQYDSFDLNVSPESDVITSEPLTLDKENGYWIVCQPNDGGGNYNGDFDIESVDLIPYPAQPSFSIRNEGTATYNDTSGHTEIYTDNENNSIIRSYPLPTTRKVIVAMGNGGYTAEQYNNLSGFDFENDKIYTVSFNITGTKAGSVTTYLACNTSFNSDWNTSSAIGKSETIGFEPGVTKKVYTKIRTTGSTNGWGTGTVVLDLGYNLGSIEVSDLKVMDNYDPNIRDHEFAKGTPHMQNGILNSYDNMTLQQFIVMDNLTIKTDDTYTITVRMKATQAGKLCMKLGGWNPNANRQMRFKNFPASSDWQDITFTVTGVPEPNDGMLSLQLQTPNAGETDESAGGSNNYGGIVIIQMVKITSDSWADDKSNEIKWDYTGMETYPYEKYNAEYPKIENNKLIIKDYVANGATRSQFLLDDAVNNLDTNRSYRLYLTAKGTEATRFRTLLGQWGDGTMAVGETLPVNTELSETFVQYDRARVKNNIIVLQTPDTKGTIEIEGWRLAPNAYERTEVYTASFTQPVSINSYNNFEITGEGLQVNVQGNKKNIIENLSLESGKTYMAEFDIKAAAGRYVVSLGNNEISQVREIEITSEEADKLITKTVEFGPNGADYGTLSITPVGYTPSLEVQNGKVMTYTPAFNSGDKIGTDFFDVELKDNYILDGEGKYLFHIGYATNGINLADGTPRNIMICGSNDGRNYERLGTYEVGEWSNGNAFVSTVTNPLNNISSNMKYLRFYCLDNEGGETAICFPKDQNGNYDQDNAYIGSMLRMTRFGIYKQSTMFATDKAKYGYDLKDDIYEKYDMWAIPVITRFQIEALGQKYAYPGATLNDMLGVKKDVEVCGELFDNDNLGKQWARTTYWDTTWPLLKDQNVATDRYQYIDYNSFTYPADDDGNRNYDCIDLLLPDMDDLGVVKKLNGKIDENKGYYQIVVNMKRSTGYVDAYNDRLVYQVTATDEEGNKTILTDETGEFKNRANGFPMEISYQGFTIDGNYTKNIHTLDNTEKVITFPNVAAGDSIQFALKVEKGWDGVRIFCRENTGNLERRAGGMKETNDAESDANTRVVNVINNAPVKGTRMMRLGEIRAYVELNKIDLESKEGRARYDLLYNNRENFNTKKWKHTKGIIDDINNVNSAHDSTDELYMKKGSGGQTWEDVIAKYKDFFEEQGIEYPDFSLLENPFNDEDVVPSNGMQRVKSSYDGQLRQRSYTILHEVLALPGERIDLYPQSDIWQSNGYNYEEQFVRWYDYLTDKAPDYLYFFSEPKSVIKTQDAGFIGGKTLLDHGYRGKGTVASLYFNTTDPNADWSYDDHGTTRMKDQWVAADFSLAFNNKLQQRLGRSEDQSGEEIKEPIVNFRHLFHITSGSLFADRYMATVEGNQHYAKTNRRYISTFAGKTFRIRLEQAMPVEETTKSPFYYKTEEIDVKGNPVYKRVRGYDIHTYKLEDNQKSDDLIKTIKFTAENIDSIDIMDKASGAKDRMFIMDDASIFPHIDSYVQTTTDPSKWLRDSKLFARSIKCDKKDANKGRYLVRIYGKDENKNLIHLKNNDGEEMPLVIAEYEVEFVDDLHASMLSEQQINELTENSLQYHHTEAYLDDHYGNGKSEVKAVNFDKYTILKSDNVIVDKGTAPVNFYQYGFYEYKDWGLRASRLKLPIAWGNSNYGFGYAITGDYNMFRLADHSGLTPYRTAADKRTDNPYDAEYKLTQDGTYDRLFYNTGGKEKGLFYYVNAAADPGEMVKIDFDYLCPGSTIYVSAWVNEFNEGQSETANVIFNFYANVAKDENGEKTILRQEQIHGFATGYVNKNPEGSYESGVSVGGDQGKWMHVYYSFVPDAGHADVIKADGEYIDSYYLVLENNCLSSSGADYAIDDIRAYVVAPRVEAHQSNVLCEKDDSKIDIQVELPLAALEQSLDGQADDRGIVRLQYSLVDKVIYDNYLDSVMNVHVGQVPEYELTSDDYYTAFAKGVLHYKHENILSDDHKDENGKPHVAYPTSWGVIEFYMDYKDKDDSFEIELNGNSITIGEYKKKYLKTIEKEQCFVFTTHPVSEDEAGKVNYNEFIKTHRDYYVVVDNIGSTGVFSSLFYEYDNDGNLVKNEDDTPVFKGDYTSAVLDKKNSDVYPHEENAPYDEKLPEWEEYDVELAKAYQIGTDCARMTDFSLRSAAQIVVDGVLHETDDNITCCENQRPVVQINLKTRERGVTENPDLGVIDGDAASENPYLDWYNGPFEDFAEEMSEIISGKEKLSLWDILDDFRSDYPNAGTWDVPVVGETDSDGNLLPTGEKDDEDNILFPQKYTYAMRKYLKDLCATTKVDETTKETIPVEPKLVLHRSSYMFPQVKTILVDEEGKKLKSKDIYVTAIPKSTPTFIEKDEIEYVICTQPREIKITVTNTSPTMLNGFLGISYPETIEDVPLRIGLNQLDKIVSDKYEDGNSLFIPLRNINPATFDVTDFHAIAANTDVYLVETNDPAYRQISDYIDPADDEIRGDSYDVETRVVGRVRSISAEFSRGADGSVILPENVVPMAHVGFFVESEPELGKNLTTGITFREGYYYKFRFHFEEGGGSMYGTPGFEEPCNGQTVFSIKVVPEYQQWTGGASLNWNNDENWRRVSKEDLLADSDTPYGIKEGLSSGVASDDRFTTTGANKNEFSYAPLNFTKVIIPAGASYPQLAPKAHSYTYDYDASVKTVNVNNGRLDNNYKWIETAPDAIPVANMTVADKYNTGDHKEETNTHPTVYINYDMAAIMYNDISIYQDDFNVYCRPWYANACDEIHFNSNAELLNQQNLDYNKAWVDMEMKPHRWYTVASPLYGVVAGDMYLPTELTDTSDANYQAGRQQTELFAPITYDEDKNDRFAPAVYQRGWDKGSETVYNLAVTEGSVPNCPKQETVALASTWSHVYNDVTESYTVGGGYSVKTDVTRLSDFQSEKRINNVGIEEEIPAEQSLVKFRFPKADANFNYYVDGSDNTGNKEHDGSLDRTSSGKLYNFEAPVNGLAGEVVLSKNNEGTLFLVGNPFMAHLDMMKFLEVNNGVIAQKYWILSEGEGQIGVVMVHDKEDKMISNETLKSGTIEANSQSTGRIAPMQGFFVQALAKGKDLKIKFTPDMMWVPNVPDAPENYLPGHLLKAPAAPTRADDDDIIRVSTSGSTAIIRLNQDAEKGYLASEDVEMIDDSNQHDMRRIYTVAGSMASAINQTPDADGIEVGLMAPTDSVTVVTFTGIALEDYMLYDTATGEITQLYDGFELEMEGSVSGRFFLTSGIDTAEIEDGAIRIVPEGQDVLVTAPAVCGELTVRVFDTLGREVAKAEGFEREVRIALDPGIYAVEVTGSESGHKSTKLSIR